MYELYALFSVSSDKKSAAAIRADDMFGCKLAQSINATLKGKFNRKVDEGVGIPILSAGIVVGVYHGVYFKKDPPALSLPRQAYLMAVSCRHMDRLVDLTGDEHMALMRAYKIEAVKPPEKHCMVIHPSEFIFPLAYVKASEPGRTICIRSEDMHGGLMVSDKQSQAYASQI